MGKYSKGMRAWSEKQLAQFICRVFDEEIKRYTGPTGPPGVSGPVGPPGPQGPPGVCQCSRPEWWGRPYVVTNDANGIMVNADSTALPMEQYLYTYSACGCQWTGGKGEDAPAYCQHGSSLIRKETL